MIQRRTPLKRTPLKKQSKKRAKESRVYLEKRIPFLERHPICQIWLDEKGWSQIQEEPYPAYARNGLYEFIPAETAILVFKALASSEVHHRARRTGDKYLDQSTWIAISSEKHRWVHDHPKEARAKGYLI